MYIHQTDRTLLKQQVKQLAHHIEGEVLDVGAGEVARYETFFDYDNYLKTDISDGKNVDVVASADDLPFEDETFDSVISTQVFEHLKQPRIAASEISRVLKPGGKCLITVPQMNELHEEPHDYFRYTKFGLVEVFEKAGFRTVTYDQRGGFFAMLAQIKMRYLIDRFSLYKKPIIGRCFGKYFALLDRIALFFDGLDKSKANRKHTIGWAFVFEKK